MGRGAEKISLRQGQILQNLFGQILVSQSQGKGMNPSSSSSYGLNSRVDYLKLQLIQEKENSEFSSIFRGCGA